MKKIIALLIGMLFCNAIFANGEKEKLLLASQAIISAESWLSLLDQGKYEECYESAAVFFKNAVQKDSFIQNINRVVKPLGKIFLRELIAISFTRQLTGAPDGEYVVLLYKTTFENKKESVETITPMLEKDGSWKISGYYIK